MCFIIANFGCLEDLSLSIAFVFVALTASALQKSLDSNAMAAEIDEGYFNDLSRQPHTNRDSPTSPVDPNCTTETYDQSDLPKTKRIACVVCRKRKLKCDGNRPKCATCSRLGHNCAYDEVRKKSGPKRGYVKELEARLGMRMLRRASVIFSI